MLTTKYRPQTFQEIVGQPVTVELLRSIVKTPESSPRVLIFHGDYGTGKTTSARVLARALNCQEEGVEPCGSCANCTQDPTFSTYCHEFDASDVGSKEAIEDLRDNFFSPVAGVAWRVVILDEFHLASRQAQSALLKTLEDLPARVFTVFCTTNVDRILPTLRSRAVDLTFQRAPHPEVRANLSRIAHLEGIEIKTALLDLICRRCRGHIRDSVMLLDVFQALEDKRAILHQLRSVERDLIHLFTAVRQANKDLVAEKIQLVLDTPLDTLRGDLYQVIQEALRYQATGHTDSSYEEDYRVLVESWRADLVKLLTFSLSDWAVNSFKDDRTVQSFFWSAFLSFGRARKSTSQASANRFQAKRGAN